jgi:hypothetical protein
MQYRLATYDLPGDSYRIRRDEYWNIYGAELQKQRLTESNQDQLWLKWTPVPMKLPF